jgi:hypothetical protein
MAALHPFTNVGSLCVYDPSSISEPLLPTTWKKLQAKLDELINQGQLLFFDFNADGDYWLHLSVDEDLPERFRSRAQPRASGFLKVPAGRLIAVGTEELSRPSTKGEPKMGDEAAFAPGIYQVQAFTVDWQGREIEAELKKRANPEVLKKHKRRERSMILLFYGSVIGTVAFLVKLAMFGAANWTYWLAVLLLFWGLVVFSFRWYARSEIKQLQDQVDSEFPSIILQFKKVEPTELSEPIKGFRLDLDL